MSAASALSKPDILGKVASYSASVPFGDLKVGKKYKLPVDRTTFTDPALVDQIFDPVAVTDKFAVVEKLANGRVRVRTPTGELVLAAESFTPNTLFAPYTKTAGRTRRFVKRRRTSKRTSTRKLRSRSRRSRSYSA